MKAWRFYGFGDMRLDEVATPEPGPGQVLLRVLVVQPSVTEAILASGRETIGFEKVRARLAAEAPVGLFGHEYCAEVIAVGPGVERVSPGERVVGYSMLPCTMPGCLAEYAVCPENGVVAIPDALSPHEAAAVQPAAECVASVQSADIRRGETVAIVGQGAMGIESAGGPPEEGLAGSATVEQSFALVRNCGRVVINSLIPGRTGLDFVAWRSRSIALVFPGLGDLRHLATAAQMTAQGRLQMEPLISHVVRGLEQAPPAFEITAEKGRFGATGPCQIVVDTERVELHPRTFDAETASAA
jgi:threonine dehydrogenase-like Zn-dependent dehydrogenase